MSDRVAFKQLALGFRDLARVCVKLEAAFGDLAAEPPPPPPRPRAAKEPRPADPLEERTEGVVLSTTERKILTALAQAGKPRTVPQLGAVTGLSSGAGSFTKALAQLRRHGFVQGTGALSITPLGADALGPFTRLPEWQALFDYWCEKTGGTAAKILRALRADGSFLSAAAIGNRTGLSHTAGSFTKALAKLRRLQLIEGSGAGMNLSDDLRQACEPTLAVFDRQSGREVKISAKTGLPR